MTNQARVEGQVGHTCRELNAQDVANTLWSYAKLITAPGCRKPQRGLTWPPAGSTCSQGDVLARKCGFCNKTDFFCGPPKNSCENKNKKKCGMSPLFSICAHELLTNFSEQRAQDGAGSRNRCLAMFLCMAKREASLSTWTVQARLSP
jgi:hypothetical protein